MTFRTTALLLALALALSSTFCLSSAAFYTISMAYKDALCEKTWVGYSADAVASCPDNSTTPTCSASGGLFYYKKYCADSFPQGVWGKAQDKFSSQDCAEGTFQSRSFTADSCVTMGMLSTKTTCDKTTMTYYVTNCMSTDCSSNCAPNNFNGPPGNANGTCVNGYTLKCTSGASSMISHSAIALTFVFLCAFIAVLM